MAFPERFPRKPESSKIIKIVKIIRIIKIIKIINLIILRIQVMMAAPPLRPISGRKTALVSANYDEFGA